MAETATRQAGRLQANPLIARLLASVPPLVNTTWDGGQLTNAETCSLAVSMALRTTLPARYKLEGLP